MQAWNRPSPGKSGKSGQRQGADILHALRLQRLLAIRGSQRMSATTKSLSF